jgi:hypothetical protein
MPAKYTYMWQLQQYKPDKGISRIEVAPSNARPLSNGEWDNNQFNDAKDGNAFLPRPIKHWRRQLQPDPIRGGSKSKTIVEVFQPGGTVYLNGKVNEQNKCCETGNITTKLPSYISISKNNKYCSTNTNCSYTVTAKNVADGWNGPIGKKICCNPVYNRIKPATTILSKKYYTDSRAYLRSRNKLYNQKLTTLPYPGVIYYGSNGKLLYPNNNPLGPQTFSTGECPQNACNGNQQITIFKPNNRQFFKQGAVESSTRLEKLKLDTANKSGRSLRIPYGNSAAKAGSYYLNGTTPYLVKDKIGTCENHHRKGDFTNCFHTNTGSIFTNNRRITTISPYMYPPSLSS